MEHTELWGKYRKGVEYQEACGMAKNIPKYVDFYEGRQWAKPTKNTKNLPRPVANIIKMICRNKQSAVLSTPVKIVYHAENAQVNTEKFNRFADYILKEMNMDDIDKLAVGDGVKKGSYFYHFYWDTEAKGKDGIEEGALRCDIIDPLNIFFSNPTQLDEQKQEWIIIASRESVKSVKAKADKGVDLDLITSDENEDKYKTVEQKDDELCTVLTEYFRKDGEVYCTQATKAVVFKNPFPITPNLSGAGAELGIDEPNNSLPDKADGESLVPERARASLYPIVVGNYERKERSIYGLSEVEGLIPNQKAINFLLAMDILNAQETAWGKYIVNPKALRGQVITNEPGQVLIDYTETQNGIKRLSEAGYSNKVQQIVDSLMQTTRVVTGSTEVMTGETLGSSMSGAAIAQLQSQALQPVAELKDSFWNVKEKQGRVLAQFFKLYYMEMEKEFTYEDNEEQFLDVFNGKEYENVDFSVVVEATAGTKASAAGDITALDVLLAKGAISIKTYVKAYPEDALSNKSELLKNIEEEEKGVIKQLQAELERAQAQNLELAKVVESQKATVDRVVTVIDENSKLKAYIAKLYTEATQKINLANQQITAGNAKIAEVEADAREFAEHIYQREYAPRA